MHEYSTKSCVVCETDFECATSYPERSRVYCSKLCSGRAAQKKLKEQGPSTRIVVTERRCGHCGETRDADEFYKDATRPDGLKPWCKPCTLAEQKGRYDPQYEVDRRARLKQDPEWVAKEKARGQARNEAKEKKGDAPKTCKGCGIEKTRNDFYRHQQMADGLLNYCKECVSTQKKLRYPQIADALSAKFKKRWKEDPKFRQKSMNQQRRWRLENREHVVERVKAYYEANKEKMNECSRRGYETRAQWLFRQKEGKACVRCGMSDARCLDWHHIDPSTKVFNIGEASGSGIPEDEVLYELSKCQTICRNCHAITHWEEQQARKAERARKNAQPSSST